MKIYDGTVNRDPVVPMGVASKQYVDAQILAGTTNLIIGQVYITNVTPTATGIVGAKEYVPDTVPANAVLTAASSDTVNVRVHIHAEGGVAFFSPSVTINGVNAVLTKSAVGASVDASRVYTGYADIVVSATGDTPINVVSSTGATAAGVVRMLAAGPAFSALVIGSLPGAQTEAKSGDVITVTGSVANDATYAEILASGAAASIAVLTLGAADSAGAGFKTVTGTFTVGSGTGSRTISARARNSFGTYGTTFGSSNSITLNQTYPTIGAISIAYPASQGALKGTESATVTATITNADTYSYTSSADLSVGSPTTYAAGKTVSRVSGTYVNGTNNYFISATKASNGATSTAQAAIKIANVAPTVAISISGNPSRLISSPAGQNYTVTITANQVLNSAPTLVASSGTWQGSWSGSGTTWTRTLRIADADLKGAQTFNTLTATGLANVVGSTITAGANYTVGGFVMRQITFAAFSQFEPIGTQVLDISKVTAKYSGAGSNLSLQNSTANVFQGFTITDAAGVYAPTGTHIFITDADFAGANTTGTLIVEVSEAA